MARLLKVLLGVGLTGMLASGPALATLFSLGDITPGPTSFRAIAAQATPGVAVDDQYGFNVVGSEGKLAASVVSEQVTPNDAASVFNTTAQLFGWNGTSFVALTGLPQNPGGATILPANVTLAPAIGGDQSGINFAYYLEVKSVTTPAPGAGNVAGYGGSMSIAAIPEPSTVLLLLGGIVSAAFLGRRRFDAAS